MVVEVVVLVVVGAVAAGLGVVAPKGGSWWTGAAHVPSVVGAEHCAVLDRPTTAPPAEVAVSEIMPTKKESDKSAPQALHLWSLIQDHHSSRTGNGTLPTVGVHQVDGKMNSARPLVTTSQTDSPRTQERKAEVEEACEDTYFLTWM